MSIPRRLPTIQRILLAASLVFGAGSTGAETARLIQGTRIELGEVSDEMPEAMRGIDIGPSPPPGSSRLLARSAIERQIRAAGFDPQEVRLPKAVRVRSEGKHFSKAELADWLTPAVKQALPSGATLVQLTATAPQTFSPQAVPGRVLLPKLPKRIGATRIGFTIEVAVEGVAAHRVPVTAVLELGPQAARFDVERGAVLNAVIVRRTARITARAQALLAGDVGDVIVLRIQSTGRTLKGRLESPSTARVVEGAN